MARTIRDPRCRERIVEAAWRLAAAGLSGTTVRGIAEEAGVSTGSVTHYFEDKEQIMSSVLRYNNKRAVERLLAAVKGRTGLAALESGVQAILPLDAARLAEWTVWCRFWTREAAPGTDSGGSIAGLRTALRGQLVSLLTQAVADGELGEGLDLPYEADRIVMLATGIGLFAATDPTQRTALRRMAKRMLTDHLTGLRATQVTAVMR